jgi:hypothetical protein
MSHSLMACLYLCCGAGCRLDFFMVKFYVLVVEFFLVMILSSCFYFLFYFCILVAAFFLVTFLCWRAFCCDSKRKIKAYIVMDKVTQSSLQRFFFFLVNGT